MPRTESYRDALVIPTGNWAPGEHRGHVFDGGICTSAGEPVRLAQHGHGPHRNETLPAGAIAPARRLGGRWLFGGWYRGHFGHLVSESLGRLWALKDGGPWAGVIFLRYGVPQGRATQPLAEAGEAMPLLAQFLGLLGITPPALMAAMPVAVEELVVPESLSLTPDPAVPEGSRMLRRFIADSMQVGTAASPLPARIYLSRSGLSAEKSRFVLEGAIEENLARAGYAIIHPERLSIADQIQHYRAAGRLVFAEGSAIHLAVPFLGTGQRVGILWRLGRRHPRQHAQLADTGIDALVECAGFAGGIVSSRQADARKGRRGGPLLRRLHSLPDFAVIGRALEEGGLIPPDTWRVPGEAEQRAAMAALLAERRAARPDLEHQAIAADVLPRLQREAARKAGQRGDGRRAERDPA